MKRQTESNRLLEDILGDSLPSGFQTALLNQTLRQVRQRRRVRQASRCLVAAALVLAIPLVLWKKPSPPGEIAQLPPQALGVVRSQPLAASMIIQSQAGSVNLVNSSADSVKFVETGAIRGPFREIDDEQLLALAGGRPVALVRHDSEHAELLLLNPDDRRGFEVP